MKRSKWTNESIDNFILSRNLTRLDEYCGCMMPINWKCQICSYIWKTSPKHILNSGSGCPKCKKHVRLTNDDVDVRCLTKNIKRIDNYINNNFKIRWQCLTCDHIWKTKPDHILNSGSGCPICAKMKLISKGENTISNLLKNNGIVYVYQHEIHFNGNRYFIDFYIPEFKIFIEYNGPQHYKPVKYWTNGCQDEAIKKLEEQKERDKQVKQFCVQNDIILSIINYKTKDYLIEGDLSKILNLNITIN